MGGLPFPGLLLLPELPFEPEFPFDPALPFVVFELVPELLPEEVLHPELELLPKPEPELLPKLDPELLPKLDPELPPKVDAELPKVELELPQLLPKPLDAPFWPATPMPVFPPRPPRSVWGL